MADFPHDDPPFNLPKAPTFAPGAFHLDGDEEDPRLHLRKSRPNRQTKYQTPEQYEQLLEECTNCGFRKVFDENDTTYIFYQHHCSSSLYSRTNVKTGEAALWFRTADGQWKRLCHNGQYKQCCNNLYRKVLQGKIDYTGNPAENKKHFIDLVRSMCRMSETGGWDPYIRNIYWDSLDRKKLRSSKRQPIEYHPQAKKPRAKKPRLDEMLSPPVDEVLSPQANQLSSPAPAEQQQATSTTPAPLITFNIEQMNVGSPDFLASLLSSAGKKGVLP